MNPLLLYSCWLLPPPGAVLSVGRCAPGPRCCPASFAACCRAPGAGGAGGSLAAPAPPAPAQYSVQYSTVQHSTVQYSTGADLVRHGARILAVDGADEVPLPHLLRRPAAGVHSAHLHGGTVEETLQFIHRFHNGFSQSRRRPLLGPSPG